MTGITSKLDYLVDLGIDCVWITPVYPSPMDDFGYDLTDYEDIEPLFGTLQDFDDLVKEIHKKGLLWLFSDMVFFLMEKKNLV